MAETTCYSYNDFGTTEGKVTFGDVMKNNAKMAAMLRNIAPMGFSHSHYVGLVQTGALKGSTICSTPATYQIVSGEKPVNGVAGMWYAQDGDLIFYAPRGRIRLIARDIDLYASGNGTDTGWINLTSNSTVEISSNDIDMVAGNNLSVSAEASMNQTVPGEYRVNCRNYHLNEGPDVSPITSPLGSGVNSVLRTAEGLVKLIESIR